MAALIPITMTSTLIIVILVVELLAVRLDDSVLQLKLMRLLLLGLVRVLKPFLGLVLNIRFIGCRALVCRIGSIPSFCQR